MTTHTLLAWLPPQHRRPMLQRLLIVWGVALLVGLGTWNGNMAKGHPSADVNLKWRAVHPSSTCQRT